MEKNANHLNTELPSYTEATGPVATAPSIGFVPQELYSNPAPQNQSYPLQPPMAQYPAYNQHPQQYYTPPQTQQPAPRMVETVTVVSQPQLVYIGGCGACRVGHMESRYTCCGICCAICCFPIGIICCLLMQEKRCSNCGA